MAIFVLLSFALWVCSRWTRPMLKGLFTIFASSYDSIVDSPCCSRNLTRYISYHHQIFHPPDPPDQSESVYHRGKACIASSPISQRITRSGSRNVACPVIYRSGSPPMLAVDAPVFAFSNVTKRSFQYMHQGRTGFQCTCPCLLMQQDTR